MVQSTQWEEHERQQHQDTVSLAVTTLCDSVYTALSCATYVIVFHARSVRIASPCSPVFTPLFHNVTVLAKPVHSTGSMQTFGGHERK